jgi:hypothetical protein
MQCNATLRGNGKDKQPPRGPLSAREATPEADKANLPWGPLTTKIEATSRNQYLVKGSANDCESCEWNSAQQTDLWGPRHYCKKLEWNYEHHAAEASGWTNSSTVSHECNDGTWKDMTTEECAQCNNYEELTQDLEVVSLDEGMEGDVDTDSEATMEEEPESDEPEEIELEELWRMEIVAGTAKAEDFRKPTDDQYLMKERYLCARYQEKNINGARRVWYYEAKMGNMNLYIFRLAHLNEAIRQLIAEVETKGVGRSQQYKDNLAANVDYHNVLNNDLRQLRNQRVQLQADIMSAKKEDDVARIDHPQHGQLAWSACYTDSCITHYTAKIDAGYWPSRRTPVYWNQGLDQETAKQIARRAPPKTYEDWKEVILNPIPGNQSSQTKN